ncbi:MAG: hypothetical protein K0B81_06980 [Candidatus Cloacimonetes bacterium]|nr:hypothetical protein [Candidatus Cloacimonadota bacterium]
MPDYLFFPATQIERSSIPATEVAGYHISPLQGAVGAKQEIYFVISTEAKRNGEISTLTYMIFKQT